MKYRHIALILILFTSATAFGQAKKDLEQNLAACNASRDSLKSQLSQLQIRYDSINKLYQDYDTMYGIVRDKYIGFNFKPKQIGHIVDSMRAKRDSTMTKSSATLSTTDSTKADVIPLTSLSNDSLSVYKYFVDSLRSENNHYRYVFEQYFKHGTIPTRQEDLVGLWKVSLRWFEVAKRSERSGLLQTQPALGNSYIASINFIDAELAELTLSNGSKIKCFYKVNEFSLTKSYTIEFSKWKEVDIRLFVTPSKDGELYVSYEKASGYFAGFMRKQK